ncbi:group 1 glycosyl transferase [Stappia sp. 22II-S9-Z10]|nr:group 1 glycosyl transferase [Stappia sp. 22II-S9-Z10]
MGAALAVVGDATDPATFGGTPWHILEAGRAAGVVGRGLALATTAPAWRRRRLAFSAWRLATRLERGGFQYSDGFLSRLFAQDPPRPDETVINLFQLYPQRLAATHRAPLWFYIDQTLTQLFAGYDTCSGVGPRIAADAIARERAQYHAAAGVIVRSAYAARSVVEDYGVPDRRVHVVHGAANITREALAALDGSDPPPRAPGPLRLVFVGKEWQRKGLDRLIRGLAVARADGAAADLTVVGVDPTRLPPALAATPGVTFAGFVDKRADPGRFVRLLASADVGCLLSRAEAGGLSLREFASVGLPVIAPDVGGSPEYALPGASTLVAPGAPDAAIGAAIHRLATAPDVLAAQRRIAWARRHEAAWDGPLKRIGAIIAGTP